MASSVQKQPPAKKSYRRVAYVSGRRPRVRAVATRRQGLGFDGDLLLALIVSVVRSAEEGGRPLLFQMHPGAPGNG
jgi:hypothetical protein